MIIALLLAIVNPALDAFDNANDALTSCGFAFHREAAAADKGLSQFKSELGSRCADEIAQMRRAIIALETGRGKTRAAAQSSAEETIAFFYASHGDGYARRHETDAKLRALIDLVEKEGAKSDAE